MVLCGAVGGSPGPASQAMHQHNYTATTAISTTSPLREYRHRTTTTPVSNLSILDSWPRYGFYLVKGLLATDSQDQARGCWRLIVKTKPKNQGCWRHVNQAWGCWRLIVKTKPKVLHPGAVLKKTWVKPHYKQKDHFAPMTTPIHLW